MDDMRHGDHEQATAHRDHLWVAVLIAACVLLEVWASWLGIGSVSGFPKLGRVTTGWILPVATEAYWSYALWAWLAGAPGPRSKRFAMWTAGGMFALSILGQESGHLLAASHKAVPPAYVVAFVTALPLISLALVAILVHLRQADREEVAAVARAAAEAEKRAAIERADSDERTWLRAELERSTADAEANLSALRDEMTGDLEAERTARENAQRELESAQQEAAEALARAEALNAKLDAASVQKKRAKEAASGRTRGTAATDADPTNELRAVMELRADPDLRRPRMGGELARRLGIGASTGRRLHGVLVKDGALSEYAESLIEPLGDRSQ